MVFAAISMILGKYPLQFRMLVLAISGSLPSLSSFCVIFGRANRVFGTHCDFVSTFEWQYLSMHTIWDSTNLLHPTRTWHMHFVHAMPICSIRITRFWNSRRYHSQCDSEWRQQGNSKRTWVHMRMTVSSLKMELWSQLSLAVPLELLYCIYCCVRGHEVMTNLRQ